ncbi:MAG: 2-oxo acid dehydrogenase subunit E2, partial [Hyphomicrobiales bacterium]
MTSISAATPTIRALARKLGIDVDQLALELQQDRVSEADVLRKVNGGSAPSSSSGYWDVDHTQYGPGETVPMSRFAQLAAANLTASQQHIPAVTHHDKVCMDAVESFRKTLADEGAKRGIKVTAMVFHIIALTKTLQK